ncbi:short-chain dehydrogenase, partial [Streptomyces rochei]|nr:short-chain dehydrogenase [Streptomyces rochei]
MSTTSTSTTSTTSAADAAEFAGRTALVTGGASGIGLATARRLGAGGAN